MSEPLEGNDSVGYGNPPQATRFAKGRSGNPKGRPRGSRNIASIFNVVTREKVRVTENGKIRNMSKLEAILRQLTMQALSGDLKAIKDVLALKQVFDAVPDQTSQEGPDTEKNQAIMRHLIERLRSTPGGESDSIEPAVQPQIGEETI